jgi:hypothetical protein
MQMQVNKFGYPGGPCVGVCGHALCEKLIQIAGTRCFVCHEKIGYGEKYDNLFGMLAHVKCATQSHNRVSGDSLKEPKILTGEN